MYPTVVFCKKIHPCWARSASVTSAFPPRAREKIPAVRRRKGIVQHFGVVFCPCFYAEDVGISLCSVEQDEVVFTSREFSHV